MSAETRQHSTGTDDVSGAGDSPGQHTLATALAISSTLALASCGSRKAALQAASELIIHRVQPIDPDNPVDERQLFDALVSRERLGSTAFGDGVAIPHCRLPQVSGIQAALLTLAERVDFDAPDDAGVDLLCVLIVGEDSGDAHLKLLSTLASVLSDPANRAALRAETAAEGLHDQLLKLAANGLAG